ncbi:MAG: thiamine phosphate synthase [Actinomycetota bacterium]|nr:thiamine phosphate synthase [Actinomycetota bacterium]
MRPPLPRLLAVTETRLTGGRPLGVVLEAAVSGGLRAVLVRDKHLAATERRRLVDTARSLLAPRGGIVLVASDRDLGGDGVHLAAGDPFPRDAPGLVGRSCHSIAEVAKAAAEGCAYVTLSPVFSSRSKPGYGPALGTAVLSGGPIPVLALGGVDAANAASCVAAGAAGVAVMGALMGAEDPAACAAALVAAVTTGPAVEAKAEGKHKEEVQ